MRKFEDGHFRPTPVQDSLAITQTAVDVEMAAVEGVVAVGEFSAAMMVEAFADSAGGQLPAVGVAAEHPLPGVVHQFPGVGGIVVEADDGKGRIDVGETFIRVDVARPFIIKANDDDGFFCLRFADVHGIISQDDQAAIFEAGFQVIGAAFAFGGLVFAVDAVVVIAESADGAEGGFEVGENRGDAMGEAISAGDEIAGHHHQIGIEIVDPRDVLNQVALPDDGGIMQVGDLHDLEADVGGVEVGQGHRAAMDVDPLAIQRQGMSAGEAEARHGRPDGFSPFVLATPVGVFQIMFDRFDHVLIRIMGYQPMSNWNGMGW